MHHLLHTAPSYLPQPSHIYAYGGWMTITKAREYDWKTLLENFRAAWSRKPRNSEQKLKKRSFLSKEPRLLDNSSNKFNLKKVLWLIQRTREERVYGKDSPRLESYTERAISQGVASSTLDWGVLFNSWCYLC